MMKVAYLALAASAVLASPIEPVVDAKKPANVCHAAPYKQWLSLSELPSAVNYCHKNFPKKTPTCPKAVTITPKPRTEKYTVTQTTTEVDASIFTMTTGEPSVITITEAASPSITFVSSTATAPTTTITGCSTASGNGTMPASSPSSGNSSMPEFGNSTAAINRRQLAKSPVDLAAKKKKGTKTKLSPKAKKSLQARLKSLKKLDKKAKATTICHCIEDAPACTKKTHTAPQSTVTETVYRTTGIVSEPVTTITVSNTQTLTNISFVPATTTATVFLNAGTITPTAYAGCNATSTGSA
ncbi:hypothetical protein MBLNU457_4191t1 [Dothideomycetes sp. NU457]